jgi:FK506-binding nuclear protein
MLTFFHFSSSFSIQNHHHLSHYSKNITTQQPKSQRQNSNNYNMTNNNKSNNNDDDTPKHIIRSLQVQKPTASNNTPNPKGSKDLVTIEKSFPIGSFFSFPIQVTKPSNDEKTGEVFYGNPMNIDIPSNTKLTIDTIAIDPLSMKNDSNAVMSLYVKTDFNEFTCVCPYLSSHVNKSHHYLSMVQHLNLNFVGPNTVEIALVLLHPNTNNKKNGKSKADDDDDAAYHATLIGNVEMVDEEVGDVVMRIQSDHLFENDDGQSEEGSVLMDDDEKKQKKDENQSERSQEDYVMVNNAESVQKAMEKQKDARINGKNKRKIDDTNTSSTKDDDLEASDRVAATDMKKLTKKQRRKLAKQKAKQLQEVVAKNEGHTINDSKTNPIQQVKRKVSLTNQRSLPGGVLVRDIIHGSGPDVKIGRKVSINYVGTFADNEEEFDKNTSKSKPLVFRLGTGEVIKGLDKGLEGMKVGGERIITIPPKLGYGKKGSGKIPGNSTLCFDVKLLNVGLQ